MFCNHELQDGHLTGYVLVGDPVRVEHDVALAGVELGALRVIQATEDYERIANKVSAVVDQDLYTLRRNELN